MKFVKYAIAFIVIAGLVYSGLMALEGYTPTLFATLSAALISLAFEKFPFLQNDFDQLPENVKRLVMVGFMIVLVYGSFGLSCLAWLVAFPCTGAGALSALQVLILAIAANQGVFFATKRS